MTARAFSISYRHGLPDALTGRGGTYVFDYWAMVNQYRRYRMRIQDNPLYDQLSALLQKAGMFEATNIPESRKSINVNELDISIRMANMLNNGGIYTIWDLVPIKIDKWRYFNSRPRMSELIDALDKAIKVLVGEIQISPLKGFIWLLTVIIM